MSEPVRNGLRLALLLGQRGIELVSIRRQDVNLDAAIWTIPAAISKNGKAHLVPLPPMARQILAGTMATATPRIVKKAMQTDVPWLFPNPSRTDHIERHALSAALLDSQDKFGFILLGTEGSDPPVYNGFSPHDLRRTLASHVELLGHSTSVVGAILNHAGARKGTVTGRHYTVAELTALKRRALLDWEKAVREILAGRDPFAQSHEDRLAEEARVLGFSAPESNVVALKRPA